MADTITLILNILFAVLIFFGIFWGFIRGLKKTVSRLLFLLLTSVVLIFITVPIINPIVDMLLNLPFNMSLNINGVATSGSYTLLEIVSLYVKDFLGENFVQDFPELVDIIISLPIVLINAFVYVIFFWLLKYLLLPLYWIINAIIFKKKKRKAEVMGFADLEESNLEETNNANIQPVITTYSSTPVIEASASRETITSKKKEKKEKVKQKKYRLWGALVGVAVGLVTTFSTMIPIYGVINILNKHNNTTFKNLTDEQMSLHKMSDGMTTDIIKGYDLSILGRLSRGVGLQAMGTSGFDRLTTIKIDDDTKISLRDSVDSIVTTAVEADNLIGLYKSATENGLENITQDDLTALLNGVDMFLAKCQEIEFVDALSTYVIPVANRILQTKEIKIVENEQINKLIIESIVILAEESNINVFAELQSLVDVAKYLNDQKLLIRIVNNNYENILSVIQNLDNNFADEFTNKLYGVKIVDSILPNIFSIALTFADNALEFGYDNENPATKTEIQDSFTNLLDNIITTAKTLNTDSSYYVTDETLLKLGVLLDSLKTSSLYNTVTYTNLSNYALDRISKSLTSSLPDNFRSFFNDQLMISVENLSDVNRITAWTTEMQTIYDALQILRHNENGILGDKVTESEIITINENGSIEESPAPLRKGYTLNFDIKENTFINLGLALDKLEQSKLLGSRVKVNYNGTEYDTTTLISFITCLFDELKSNNDTKDTTTQHLLGILDIIEENLLTSGHTNSTLTQSSFWKDEMTEISKLVVFVNDMTTSEDLTFTEEKGIELGKILDNCAHNSVILGKKATLDIVSTVCDILEDSITNNENYKDNENLTTNISKLITSIKNRLDSQDVYNKLHPANPTPEDSFWENEIKSLSAMIDAFKGSDESGNFKITVELGKSLDNLKNTSYLIDTDLSIDTLDILLEIAKEELFKDGSVFNDYTTLKDSITNILTEVQSNLKLESTKTTIESKSDFFENEFTLSMPLITFITDTLASSDIQLTDDLGTALDSVADTTLVQAKPTIILVSSMIDIAKDQILGEDFDISTASDIDKNINIMFTNIGTNLNDSLIPLINNNSNFWKTEIGNFINLKEISETTDSINSISDARNIAQKLDTVYLSSVINGMDLNNILAITFDQIKPTITSDSSEVEKDIVDLIDSIKTDITTPEIFNTFNKNNFWERELYYLDLMKNMFDGIDSNIVSQLETIGEQLDNITLGTNDPSKPNTTCRSNLITQMRVRNILSSAISEQKESITNPFETNLKTSVGNTLDNISNNLKNDDIIIDSLKTELKHLQNLANINISSDLFTTESSNASTLNELGRTLDSIAYNTIFVNTSTEYNSALNSVLISRLDINNIVATAFETSINSSATDTIDIAFNNMITTVANNIKGLITSDQDKVIKWSQEFSFVSLLLQLDTDGIDISTAETKLGSTLDRIAFNTYENEYLDIDYDTNGNVYGKYEPSFGIKNPDESTTTYYYNSVLITRTAIKNLISSIMDTIKISTPESAEEEITNELITNLSSSINTTDNISETLYNNYSEAFSDLHDLNEEMNDTSKYFDGKTLDELTQTDMENVDVMLSKFQDKIVCGTTTTRKIAIVILDKLEIIIEAVPLIPSDHESLTYITNYRNYLNTNINNTEKEDYHVETSTQSYPNPFVTLYDIKPIISA